MGMDINDSLRWRKDIDRGSVIKEDGKCFIQSQWRYCPHWVARHKNIRSTAVWKYHCRLFNKEKPDENALPECNKQYGRSNKPKL